MFFWNINMQIKTNPPISDQVFNLLLEQIQQGHFKAGERLPSESAIAQDLDVSRSSVRTALARLEAMGFINRFHGEGTFVRKRLPQENVANSLSWNFSKLIKDIGQEPRIKVLSQEIRLASDEESNLLELEEGKQVFHLERIFIATDDPVIYTKSVFPLDLFPDPSNLDGKQTMADFLKSHCDVEIAYIISQISAISGISEIEQVLDIDLNYPLLRLEEVGYSDIDEKPVETSDSYLKQLNFKMQRIRPWANKND
jgi:GntR family transcriptional regulator